MPYTSIAGAKDAGFPTVINGVNLSLAQVNHLAEIYDAIKADGGTNEPMGVAIARFKKQYRIEGDKWVKVQQGAEISMSEVFQQSYVNEHSCTLKDPSQFDRCIRITEGKDGSPIDPELVVCYKKGDNEGTTQALRYKTSKWSETQARAHCREKGGTFYPAREKESYEEMAFLLFREINISSLKSSQAAMSYHNRLHAMYVDNRQTGKQFSKQWVIDKHRELVDYMEDMGWRHPERGDALDKTLKVEKRTEFDDSGLKEGKEILVLELGKECSSADGKERLTVTAEMCDEIVKNYNAGHHPGLTDQGAPIDADHKLVSLTAKEPIKEETSLDRLFGYLGSKVKRVKKGLALAAPLWNERARQTLDVIKKIGISAAFGPYWAKRGPDAGKKVGYTLYNITLCSNPQQGTLTLGPEQLREMFNDCKAEDLYISKPIEINFGEEDREMEFSEKVTDFLGDNPDEKIDEVIALTEEKQKLEEEKEGLEKKIEELEKRPALSEHEQVVQRLTEVETKLNQQETAERQRIMLEENVATPALLKTKAMIKACDPTVTEREEFDELVKNLTKVSDDMKGEDKGTEEAFTDAASELTAKVGAAMKEDQNVSREEAEKKVFAENPTLYERYIKESAVVRK